MKSDSKSGLCIKQVIGVFLTLVILTTHIQLFVLAKENTQLANANIEQTETENDNRTQEEVTITQTQERQIQIAARASEERKLEKKYITIQEITISKEMDLSKSCGISKEDFKILMTNLKRDTSGFFEKNSDTIYDLCEKYELNEIFFCGLIAAESGWNIASNHRNTNNYISMMSNGRLIHYSSEEEGLEAAAKLLHNKYLTEGGSCYAGGKTLSCVQKRFCPNSSTWVNLVYSCMKQIVEQ